MSWWLQASDLADRTLVAKTWGIGGGVADFFEDLRRIGVWKASRLGGRPSDRRLAAAAEVSPDTVGAWLRGQQRFPQTLDPLLSVLTNIRAEAERQRLLREPMDDFSGQTAAEVLAEDRWRRAYRTEAERRSQVVREAVERQRASALLEREERRARLAASPDRPRPVRSWTAQRLGVHPAISGRPDRQGVADFVLPAYVTRRHDVELREVVAAALGDEAKPVLVVVSGTSCTGKTRTAYETVRSVVPDAFDLLFPADAESLLTALASGVVEQRTVLWLDEAQSYLTGPKGEGVATALLRRLDENGPLLVIATLWPTYDAQLCAYPAESGLADAHRQARALLAQARRVHVPVSFADDLDALRAAARCEPPLAVAAQAPNAEVTQILAAGPDLVERYEHPVGPYGVYGQALLSAAMDACRLDVTEPLPLTFLADAAPGYLTEVQRAAATDDWFTHAVAYARTRAKNMIAPLQDVPRSSGMGAAPGMARLADYLRQHGLRTRSMLCPPATFWDAATRHLTTHHSLYALARHAEERLRYRHAAALYTRAAELGSSIAVVPLMLLAEGIGDKEAAEHLAHQSARSGRPHVLGTLARTRANSGDLEEGERLSRHAADAGDAFAMKDLALRREEAGDEDEAQELYARAAIAGHPHGRIHLALRAEELGMPEEAEDLALWCADTAQGLPLVALAQYREHVGNLEGAEQLAYRAAEAGHCAALLALAEMRQESGDLRGAAALYQRAINTGSTEALSALALLRERTGDREEAEQLAQRALDSRSVSSLRSLVRLRERTGDEHGAERLAHQLAAAGDPYMRLVLAREREWAGDLDGAERLYRRAANEGDMDASTSLAFLREQAGDREEAERLAQHLADAGYYFPLRALAELRDQAGDREDAERLNQRAADGGDIQALKALVQQRETSGDRNGARTHMERLYALAGGNAMLLAELASWREEAGDLGGAKLLYQQSIDTGHRNARDILGEAIKGEAQRSLLPYGLEADGTLTGRWTLARTEAPDTTD